ncbi:MAG: thioredoxin family protein [Chthoniobacterales bacterium]
MKIIIMMITAALVAVGNLSAAPEIGKAAPDFTAVDSNGKTHKLSDYKGKFVVLEWLNLGCPFVRKHYESHNMQNLQKQYTDKGVVWLSIVSSAPGKQGNLTPEETNKRKQQEGSNATVILLDEKGIVGRLYDAKTTPDMFVINPAGVLLYSGAIDDKKSTDVADIPTSKNYVKAALDEALAGKPVSQAQTASYGCSVKY